MNEADPAKVSILLTLQGDEFSRALTSATRTNLLAAATLAKARGLRFRCEKIESEIRFRDTLDISTPEEAELARLAVKFRGLSMPLIEMTCQACKRSWQMVSGGKTGGWVTTPCPNCGTLVRNPRA